LKDRPRGAQARFEPTGEPREPGNEPGEPELNERQKWILEQVDEGFRLHQKDIAMHLKQNISIVKRDLKGLRKRGRIATREDDSFFLADQVKRISLSIAANIADGNGRFTKADRRNFFDIARGSVQGCVSLLEQARRRDLINDEDHGKMKGDLEKIARMLAELINRLEKPTT